MEMHAKKIHPYGCRILEKLDIYKLAPVSASVK
jgi:hypothetical protein